MHGCHNFPQMALVHLMIKRYLLLWTLLSSPLLFFPLPELPKALLCFFFHNFLLILLSFPCLRVLLCLRYSFLCLRVLLCLRHSFLPILLAHYVPSPTQMIQSLVPEQNLMHQQKTNKQFMIEIQQLIILYTTALPFF